MFRYKRSLWNVFLWREKSSLHYSSPLPRHKTFCFSRFESRRGKEDRIAMLAGIMGFVGVVEVYHLHINHTAQCDARASSASVRNTEEPVQSVSPEMKNVLDHPPAQKSFLSDSYRKRIFFEYERKLRKLSPPEKVFEYFASVKTSNGQKFMTSSDLMRAVVPVFPPSESPLLREGYLSGERHPGELRNPKSNFFMLFDTNGDGLISFSEYIFLIALLSIPECSFSTAVKMFDKNGDGTIDRQEFQKVMNSMRAQMRKNIRQYDGLRTGMKVEKNVEECGLIEFFFGKDGQKLLRHEDFEQFLRKLHEEIIHLEFYHYDYLDRGTISAKDFGLSLVAAADLSRLKEYLERVEELGNEASYKDCRITFEEFRNFAELRKKLQPLAVAISSYGQTYGLLTKADFQRAASQVCNVPLSSTVVDIVFHIFDTNQDGNLSTEEFLGVLKRREDNNSEILDSGIVSKVRCWWNCACKCNG
ncbi:hypothetical protein KP509_25G053500 [Ceratopteris richardii]|uniref:EF-hand domain-containing protein n=1 Tax=Ceratopteris richardii TaxID=49495 RepID=A0A8T2RTA1_CERRI|nr:hypothetical protein KP509_25G053500 [Ceratopteris richardii]